MNDILTDNGRKLTIFENNIIVDKKLPKFSSNIKKVSYPPTLIINNAIFY